MPLKLEGKVALVAEVNGIAKEAQSAIAAEYRGLSATDMNDLRGSARKAGVYLRVVKNTLARRALEGTAFECMSEQLKGPLVLAFAMQEPGAVARVLKDFGKTHDRLQVKIVAIGGKLIPAGDIDRLSNLPTREQALSILMGVMKAPIEKLVRTMAEPHAKLVRTVAAVRDQKQAA